MRKLNRKGFTLVELLAIIVILAVILVITVPQVFKAVDNSKKSSLESSATALVKWYNTTKAADALVTSASDKVLASYDATTTRQCLDDAFFTKAEVGSADYNTGTGSLADTFTNANIAIGTCSHYYKTAAGSVVFVLVAKNGGKLYVGNGTDAAMWAASDGTHSW